MATLTCTGMRLSRRITSKQPKTAAPNMSSRSALAFGNMRPPGNEQRGDGTIGQEEQQRRQHTEIGIPMAIVICVIPVDVRHALLEQTVTRSRVVGIAQLGELFRHGKVEPCVAVHKGLCDMVVLVVS